MKYFILLFLLFFSSGFANISDKYKTLYYNKCIILCDKDLWDTSIILICYLNDEIIYYDFSPEGKHKVIL